MATQYEQKCSQCEITDDVFECCLCEVQYCFECEPTGIKVHDNFCRYCYACFPYDESEQEEEDSDEETTSVPSEMDTSEGDLYDQRVLAGIGA